MAKQYTLQTRRIEAAPRSKRLRNLGVAGGGFYTSSGVGAVNNTNLGIDDIRDLRAMLDNKAAKEHKHNIADINELQESLDNKFDKENIIQAASETIESDENVYSASRAKLEDEKRLRKDIEDTAAERITFNKGLIAVSTSVEGAANGIIEEFTTEESQQINTSIIEEFTNAVAATLGELDNVSDDVDNTNTETQDYVLVQKTGSSDWTKAPFISGGGGTSIVRLTYVSSGVVAVSFGATYSIQYRFISTIDGEETGPGSVIYYVSGKKVYAQTINQGENSFEVGKFLIKGSNEVKVEVTDSYGTTRSLPYSIESIAISISSTFDDSQVFTGTIPFKFTPIGAISKVVHFKLDGAEMGTMNTDKTNQQLTYSIPAQTHGSHSLDVYMTAEISGSAVESNHIYYDLICVVSGNNTIIIASSFNTPVAEQYSTIIIPYVVYNPLSSSTDVELKVNGAVISRLSVSRVKQAWTYKISQKENMQMQIWSGNIAKTFKITVTESSIKADAVTENLELFLSSLGRSNSEINKSEWKFNTIATELTGFNWAADGWLPDSLGNTALHITGDARVSIPFKIFATDLRQNGKTVEIEFSTSNVRNYDDIIASCWNNGKGIQITAQNALFVSTQTTVKVQFKEEERVRISFVVEETAENRLIQTYINGVMAGVMQYPVDDSFAQVNPANIEIGSSACTIDMYNIRVYANNLTRQQILENFIADMDDINKKIALYTRNKITDAYGDLAKSQILEQLAVMTIIGDLPQYKGDKKATTKIIYEDLQDPTKSFTAENVTNDVQGTSSQYYPRKNYKFKFHKTDGITTISGKATKYKLRDSSIAVNCFCLKADFAESSGTHNTGIAKITHDTLLKLSLLTPPQLEQSQSGANINIRTTIDGFPIVVFHQPTEDSSPQFLGKYNFNNDKSTEGVFGFDLEKYPDCQCIEFLNNNTERVKFLASDYDTMIQDSVSGENYAAWTTDFEFRFPDDDDMNAQYKAGTLKPLKYKRLTDWILSTKNNVAKFKAEVADYFYIDFLLFYYIFTELLGMVDQRAKNMFATTYDGDHWLFIFYDNDTVLGIDNNGIVKFSPGIEYHDKLGDIAVWNDGADSVLWNNVELAFKNEIAAMYVRVRGVLSYETLLDVMNTSQSDKWCETIYNEDSQYKYIMPLIEGYFDSENNTWKKTNTYLPQAQGSRIEFRKWWVYNRFRYMDSKYNHGTFVNDMITMRMNTPVKITNPTTQEQIDSNAKIDATLAAVPADPQFTLTPYQDVYLKVRYENTEVGQRAYKDVPTTLPAPEGFTFTDTNVIVYGASRILDFGNLATKYLTYIRLESAVRIQELTIGSALGGYTNSNFRELSLKNNKMLKAINIRNCPNLSQALDVSGCEAIEEIYAQGSGITGVTLPAGGSLKQLHLPGSIRSITIKNQPALTESGFSIEGVSNLTTIVLENTNIDTFALINRCFSESIYKLERVRLINVQGSTGSVETLAKLINLGGVDENGNDISTAVITGNVNVDIVYKEDYDVVRATFPELIINYKWLCIKFRDPDTKAVLVNKFDINANGEIDTFEALITFEVGNEFKGKNFGYFDEFKEFINFTNAYTQEFSSCANLKTITLPPKYNLGFHTFENCVKLERCTICDTTDLSQTGGGIFYNCTSLQSFIYNNKIKIIGSGEFEKCSSLKNISLKEELTEIRSKAFLGCTSLTQIVIPSTVTTMGMMIFDSCTALESIKILSAIPATLEYAPFNGCTALIYVPQAQLGIYQTASGWKDYRSRLVGY